MKIGEIIEIGEIIPALVPLPVTADPPPTEPAPAQPEREGVPA